MELHLRVIAIILFLLATVHGGFPKWFRWKQELGNLSLLNRQMMQVHTFFIALVVGMMGLLCWSSAHELIHTPLGRRIALGLALFWTIRWGIQWFGYSAQLWKGKKWETLVHVVFSGLWIYFSTVFWLVTFGYSLETGA